ncbi:MarR family winged helix-turn-helix transcriptional regulator, partial [Breoghania sp.]|uniref:MarR family winged helix-turn-helix transcriptional regulator n=1 Tax=Breoghania sp. TaxID=2065378 RepID=UPI0026211343
MHKTKISRAVGALEARRYLTRTELENDHRLERLELTAADRKAYEDLSAHAREHDADLMALSRRRNRTFCGGVCDSLRGFEEKSTGKGACETRGPSLKTARSASSG